MASELDQSIHAQMPSLLRKLNHLRSRIRITPMAVFWTLITFILIIPITLFLSVAFSPRLFDQGKQWFTLSSFKPVFSGSYGIALLHSFILGVVAAVGATAISLSMAWLVLRTDAIARKIWNGAIFALFLAPSYLIALGWQRLFEQRGVLEIMGLHVTPIRNLLYGPVGICMVLMVKGIPFAYLVIANAMRGLGEEFEQAVRVHGGSRIEAFKVMATLLLPSIFSALAIVFAEAISDFGVASTLSNVAHFSVATYQLYQGINSIPVQFPVRCNFRSVRPPVLPCWRSWFWRFLLKTGRCEVEVFEHWEVVHAQQPDWNCQLQVSSWAVVGSLEFWSWLWEFRFLELYLLRCFRGSARY